MSNYSLLLDVAKAHQAELAREVKTVRPPRNFKPSQKVTKLAKILRISLTSLS
jgi:hypothetical protein